MAALFQDRVADRRSWQKTQTQVSQKMHNFQRDEMVKNDEFQGN
jgi:hypothetical protein